MYGSKGEPVGGLLSGSMGGPIGELESLQAGPKMKLAIQSFQKGAWTGLSPLGLRLGFNPSGQAKLEASLGLFKDPYS